MSTKGKVIKYIAFGMIGILLLLVIWGVGVEPRLIDYNEETAIISNLPAEWEGKRVALIADLQVGMWFGNEGTANRIVDRIIEERPAIVLIAGDFVYKPTDEDERRDVESEDTRDFMKEVNNAAALIRPLVQAGIPTYAVLGNHDHGMGYPDSVKNPRLADAVRRSLQETGVRVIDNAAIPLVLPDGSRTQKNLTANPEQHLYVVGIGSRYADNDQPEAALSQVSDDAPRIVVMHNPDSFAAFPSNTAPLALAGHTHGGQIRVPFTENWSWMSLATDEKIHADGWIGEGFGQTGNRLYVNRGIGFSSFPVRINCRPELTIFTLRGN